VPPGRDPGELADRALALCDGLGVRVLIGDMAIEYAREQVWGYLAGELSLDRSPIAGRWPGLGSPGPPARPRGELACGRPSTESTG
jgi:hypothetical protein